MASTCQICDEGYNKSSRKRVTCSYCSKSACSGCAKRFLVEMVSDAACMFCKKGWSREILDANFTKTWVKGEYVKRREEVLLEREKSMLPATQHLVENEMLARPVRNDIKQLDTEIRAMMLQLAEKKEQLKKKKIDLYILEHAEETGRERRVFTRACPADGCRGFLSTQWKCGICEIRVCAKCHEIKAEGAHTCDPAILASVQALAQDSKPCPTCSSMIYKVSGCDQMWCTACKTAFSWKTGRIVHSQIHNPHYIAWQAEHGAREQVEECGRDIVEIPHSARKLFVPEMWERLQNIRRMLIHVFHVEMGRLTFGQHIEQNNIDLRIRYMLKEIDEEEWKTLLQRREKRVAKETDMRMLYEMVYESGRDIFRRLASPVAKKREEVPHELEALRLYYNDELLKIGSRYASKVRPFNEQWEM